MKHSLKTILVIFAALFIAANAWSFRLLGPATPPFSGFLRPPHLDVPFTHWDLREFPDCDIPYSYHNGTPDTAGLIEFDEIDAAFQLWEDVTPARISFHRVLPGAGALCPFLRDGNNMLGWDNAGCGSPGDDACLVAGGCACGGAVVANADIISSGADDFLQTSANNCPGGGDDVAYYNVGAAEWRIKDGGNAIIETIPSGRTVGAGVLGLTCIFYNTTTGIISESDILFNDTYTWVITADQAATPTSAEVQTVAAHEIGHFLGLHHVPSGPDIDVAPRGDFPGPGDTDANGDGVLDTPMMDSPTATAMHHLHDDDRDGCNFLYDPDLGDAPDVPYPSRIHGGAAGRVLNGETLEVPRTGAEHLFGRKPRLPARNYTYEWIGNDLDSECESEQVDVDPFDDGVVLHPVPAQRGFGFAVDVRINTAADAAGNSHDYATKPMYLNIWADWNGNGIWEAGPPEQLAGPGDAIQQAGLYTRGGIVPMWAVDPVWIRVRLDWGEDAGAAGNRDGTLDGAEGAAQFGEVQDYVVPVTFGQQRYDLGDIDPCNYPTLADNPAHLITGCVWLGSCITPEGAPNFYDLDPCDDGVVFTGTPWEPCTPVTIEVTVTNGPICSPMDVFYFNFWKDGNLDRDFCDFACGGTAPEWCVVNVPVFAAGSPWVFTFTDPGGYNFPPYGLTCRARLSMEPLTIVSGPVGPCEDTTCWWAPPISEVGEVEDYDLFDQQLPVELLSFSATPGDQRMTLYWTTGSESELQQFEITRNGVKVFEIEAENNASGANYSFDDFGLSNGTVYLYTLMVVNLDGSRQELGSINASPNSDAAVITEYALHQNYPNPFNPATTITFDLKEQTFVTLTIYNLAGQEVAQVVDATLGAGRHVVTWNGALQASGVYFYRLTAGEFTSTMKMVLMK